MILFKHSVISIIFKIITRNILLKIIDQYPLQFVCGCVSGKDNYYKSSIQITTVHGVIHMNCHVNSFTCVLVYN